MALSSADQAKYERQTKEYQEFNKKAKSEIDPNEKLSTTEYNEKVNEYLKEKFSDKGLPPCNINFSNIGKIKFDFLTVKPSSQNMKIFNKIKNLDNDMRTLNDTLIRLITNLNCCSLGEKYNKNIKDQLQSITQDTCKTLLKMAEQAANSHVAFKAYVCMIKPVPGNPWLKTAGFEWMKSIYSFVYGFEAFFDWIMDGTILNVILDPLETFIKKLQTCAPLRSDDDSINYDEKLLDHMEKLKNSLPNLDLYIGDVNKQIEENLILNGVNYIGDDEYAPSYVDGNPKLVELNKKLIDQKTEYSKNLGLINSMINLEILQEIDVEQYEELNTKQKSLMIEINKTVDDINKEMGIEKIPSASDSAIEMQRLNTLINSYYYGSIYQDKILGLKNKVSCNCLFTIVGWTFNLPSYSEISTDEDFQKIKGRVLYANKAYWEKSVKDLETPGRIDQNIQKLFITDYNSAQHDIEENEIEFDQNFINNIERLTSYGGAINDVDFYYDKPSVNASIIQINDINLNKTLYNLETDPDNLFAGEIVGYLNKFMCPVLTADDKNLFVSVVDSSFKIGDVIYDNGRRVNLIKKLKQSRVQCEIRLRDEESLLRELYYDIYRFYKSGADNFEVSTIMETVSNIANQFQMKSVFQKLPNIFTAEDFIIFLGDSTIDLADFLTDSQTSVAKADLVKKYRGSLILNTFWYKFKLGVNVYTGAINKLYLLIDYDHIAIKLVDENSSLECTCDIICKLIQFVVDIIISAINAMIKAAVARLVQALMNEQVAYIIKFILSKYQCFLDIQDIPKKLDNIKTRTDQLLEEFKQDFASAPELICDLNKKTLKDKIKENEFPFEADVNIPDGVTYVLPMPTLGNETESNINNNKIVVAPDLKISEQTPNANIPNITFDCSVSDDLYIKLNTPSIKDQNYYEMNLIFSIGNIINTAVVKKEILTINPETTSSLIVNNETIEIPSIASINNITEALAKVNEKIDLLNKQKAFVQNNCSEVVPYLDFCSLNNLRVETYNFTNSDSTGLLTELTNTVYGSIERELVNDEDFYSYFPEHDKANSNGRVVIERGQPIFKYSFTVSEDVTINTTTSTSTTICKYKPTGIVNSELRSTNFIKDDENKLTYYLVDNQKIKTETGIWVELSESEKINYYNLLGDDKNLYDFDDYTDGLGKVDTIITIEHDAKKYFFTNINIVFKLSNGVNEIYIRGVLSISDVTNLSETNYDDSTYIGRYINSIKLGTFGVDDEFLDVNLINNTATITISESRILVLAKNILKDNFIIAQSISEEMKKNSDAAEVKSNEEILCLLPDEYKDTINQTLIQNDLINQSLNELITNIGDVEKLANINTINPNYSEPTIPENILNEEYNKSILLILLNEEHNIAVQIVNKKIELFIPSLSYMKSEYLKIDHELESDDIYNLTYSVRGNQIELKLLNESKQEYAGTILNNYDYDLTPVYIGGVPEGHKAKDMFTACSLCLKNLSYNTIGSGYDFYKNTVLNTSPRSAIVNLDFSMVDASNRIYNSVSLVDIIDRQASNSNNSSNTLPLIGIQKEKQQVSGYGSVVSNNFFQAYKGMMDNFFCSDNLNGLSFTFSLWFYIDKDNKEKIQTVINDDINNNHIYYSREIDSIIIDFAGSDTKPRIKVLTDDWYCIFIEKISYEKKYRIILTSKDFTSREEYILNTSINFNLMSVGSRFEKGLGYINLFSGLFGPITVYIEQSSDSEKIKNCSNQYLQIKGLERTLL